MDVLGSHDRDRGCGETEFCEELAADVQNGTYHRTDHSEEPTLKTQAMETDEKNQTWSPSPSESKVECENDNVTTESHCLICYKKFKPSNACEKELDHFTNPSSWELLKVFCKHMGVQVPSDDEAEVDGIFCEKCHDTARLLGRLDLMISVQKMISKLILGCTFAVMESPRIAWQPDCELLGRVREDILNRYCPQISLRDCCKEEDRVPIDNDDVVSFASYMVPDVEMGTDEGNNADDDVIGLTDDEEHEVPSKVKAVKRKVLRVDAAQSLSQQLQHPSTSSKKKKKGTSKGKKKVVRKVRTHPPVKRIFKEKPALPPPTRELRDRGKVSKTDDEVIVLDGPSSSKTVQAPKRIDIQDAKTQPEEIEPGKYLYLKRFNFAKVDDDDKFQCSSCDALPVDSVEDMVSHIQLTHVSQQPEKPRRAKRKRGYSFYIHKIRIDFDGSNYLCSLCPQKKRHRNLMKMHISFKHYLPFLKLKRAGKAEGTLGNQPEDLASKGENAAANSEEPKGSPRFEYIEDDEVSESEPEDPMSEEEEFIPEEIIREKMLKEKAENARLKLIEPGKYLYRNEYELQKTEDGTYICLLCKDRKKSRELLLSHIRRIHVNRKDSNKVKARIVDIGNDEFLYGDKVKITKFENQYSCGECGFLSEKLGLLRGHIRNQHLRPPKIEPEPIMCEDCGKMLMGNTALRLHRDRMHTEGEKSFVCTVCGKGFVKAKFLRHHMRGHNKDRPKNFVCEHCGKAFGCRQKLLSHVTTHTGETPFECDHCGQKFKQYNVMTVHRKACRTSTGQAPAAQAIAPAECVVTEYQQPQQFPALQNLAPHAPPIPFEFFPALYGSGRQ